MKFNLLQKVRFVVYFFADSAYQQAQLENSISLQDRKLQRFLEIPRIIITKKRMMYFSFQSFGT